MKTKLFFSTFVLLFLQIINAQTLTLNRHILMGGTDSDKISSVIYTNSDNYVASGYYKSTDGDFTANLGNYDCFVQKTDANFNLLWRTTFGGSLADYLYDIKEVENGNFIAVGYSKSNDNDITGNHGNYDYLVVKIDPNGAILWQKSFGGNDVDKATSVVMTDDGHYLILGYSKSVDGDIPATANKGGYDLWLINIDANGMLQWQKNLGGSSDDKSSKIYIIPNSNPQAYIITAYSKSNNGDLTANQGNYDFWFLKIDNNGNILWQQSYGGSDIDNSPVANVGEFSLNVLGSTNSTDGDIVQPKGNFDVWLAKLDIDDGSLITAENIGGSGADFGVDIMIDDVLTRQNVYSNLVIAAYSNSDDGDFATNNGGYDNWLLTNENNNRTATNFGGNDSDVLYGMIHRNYVLNPIIIYGTTKSNNGGYSQQHGNYDGLITIIDTGSNALVEDELKIDIYPNPAQNFINIETNDLQQITIFNNEGKLVINKQLQSNLNHCNISTADLATGIYTLKIKTKHGISVRKLIIK